MFSLRKNIYHRPKIRTKSEFCALDHGERTIAVMLLCVRTPYDRRLKRTQTVFIQNFYRRSNCLSLLLLFSFFFLSKRKKNIGSPLKREKGGLCARSQKNKKLPSTKKGREHKLPRYHPIFMGISHNTLDAYNGALPYTTTQFSLHPLQSERRYTHLRSVFSPRQTSLWQMKSYKAAFS